MRAITIFLLSLFVSTAVAGEASFVTLKDFKQWPLAAQQAYILGITDQALVDAYHYAPEAYDRIIRCLENTDAETMFQSTLDAIKKENFDDASLTLLVSDGIYEYCEKSGYKLD